MRFMRYLTAGAFCLAFSVLLLLAGCGGDGLLADGGIIGTGSIIGTVPGTVIEAYGDNGDYIETFSKTVNPDNARHPFLLKLQAGVGYYLVMIINEGTANEIVMPIAFPGNKEGEVFARIILRKGEVIDLGHVPLYLNCEDVLAFEPEEDCIPGVPFVFNKPFILNESEGSKNPLRQMDADEDGIDDFDDDDHGYGQQNGQQYKDPQDIDGDRVPNKYDDDFDRSPNDEDGDGIEDDEDENPGNIPEDDHDFQIEWNGQGMHPVSPVWLDEHGEYAEDNLEACASCHGDDYTGTQASAGVGCYSCHDGPNPEDDESPGNDAGDDEDSFEDHLSEWNVQGMHPKGQAWREHHGEYAEDNLNSCASCHGDDFRGTAASGQLGCYECHDGPDPEDD